MNILVEGRIIQLLAFIIMLALSYLFVRLAKQGTVFKMRSIPAIKALPEAVGRCTEQGRPVLFTTGTTGIYDSMGAAQTLAGLSILTYVADKCAEMETDIIVGIKAPELITIVDAICEQAYAKIGRPELYNYDKSVRYLSNDTFGYVSGTLGIMARENPGSVFFMGSLMAESIMLAESGFKYGSMMIGGTANTHQMPFITATCDYSLIGEEFFAAGAFLSENPTLLGSVTSQDITKALIVAIMLIGSIIASLNTDLFTKLLNM